MPSYKRVLVVAKDRGVEAAVKGVGIEEVLKGAIVEYHVFKPSSAVPKFKCDLMIAAGGDGTLFYAVSGLIEPSTPVLHVGMGSRGFLADVQLSELAERLRDTIEGRHIVERARKLLVKTSEGWTGKAMNEVVFAARSWRGVLCAEVAIGGLGNMDLVASGVMVSTPLGSTAFCLASGGPTLDDRLHGMVLCPISARRRWPPIVVHQDRSITIRRTGGKERAVLVIDGFIERPLKDDEIVVVSKSEETVNMIRFTEEYLMKRVERVITE
jgi:NAD+ kinase